MWLLQRKNIHKKHLLWLKIIGLCLGLHLIILLWVFCIYRENKYMYAFSINKKMDYSIPIIYSSSFALPQLHSSPPAVAKAMADKPGTPLQAETKKISQKVTTPKPITVTKPVAKSIKNEPQKTTTIAPPSQKTEVKKAPEPVKKIEPVETIKPTTTKEVKNIQQAAPKKEVVPVPVSEQKEVTPAQAQVSNNFREVEALRRGAQLQKELVQKWQPPIGVSPDCTCDISFFVNKEGIIQNLKMVKSSGVMMFDISARQALYAMKMPQWTHGKPLIINFKQ